MISSIFYEEEIVDHPRTKFIFSKFKKARKISINRYTEIFNKRDQNFKIQKSSPSLILAKKHSGHVLSAQKDLVLVILRTIIFLICITVYMTVATVFFKGCILQQIMFYLSTMKILNNRSVR